MGKMRSKDSSQDVDAILAKLSDDAHAALSILRRRIRAAAPSSATEGVSYGVPMFKIDGHPLVGFGAGKNHCALYASIEPIRSLDAELGAELDRYASGKRNDPIHPGRTSPRSAGQADREGPRGGDRGPMGGRSPVG